VFSAELGLSTEMPKSCSSDVASSTEVILDSSGSAASFVRAHVAQVLVDPVRRRRPLAIRSDHQGCDDMSRRQAAEVFQSSMISWSSKIITVGTVANSQRTSGSRPGFQVQLRVFVERDDLVRRGRRARPSGAGAGSGGPSPRSWSA
jgi:hypothetical protein